MKQNVNFRFNAINVDEYFSINSNELSYFQDPIHIATRLRNLMLKISVCLPFGNSVISISHLKFLISNVTKDKHGLTESDILPYDHQNYKSLEKIMEDRVIQCLRSYVPGSEATIVYITICKYVTSSFLDTSLEPIDRVYRIWYATYLLRIWRLHIVSSEIYTLKENFLTPSCFSCIEINAIELIKLMVKLRAVPEMFHPNMFDSQTCERTFRQLRSMGTMNWTHINFGMLELLHLVERVELQNDIIHYKLANIAQFPRNHLLNTTESEAPNIPSNEDIVHKIKQAMNDAIETAKQFELCSEQGIDPSDLSTSPLLLKPVIGLQNINESEPGTSRTSKNLELYSTSEEDEEYWEYNEGDDESVDYEDEKNDEKDDEESIKEDSITLRDSIILRSYGDKELDENSKFIKICDSDGSIKNVLKSSIVWLLRNSTRKLSNDRLNRVKSTPKRMKHMENDDSTQQEIAIGDCCFFHFDFTNESVKSMVTSEKGKKKRKKSKKNVLLKLPQNIAENSFIPNILHGTILSFQNSNQRKQNKKQNNSNFVTIKDKNNSNRKDIDALSVWSVVGRDGEIRPIGTQGSFYINLKNFIAKTDQPLLIERTNKKYLKLEDVSKVRMYIDS